MLFKRREKAGLAERLRVALWPRRSFARSLRYVILRVKRAKGSPHAVAVGFAAGVFVACTPYLGAQVISAGILAYVLGGSLLASFLGTFIGNPLTYPLIWAATYKLGIFLLREPDRFDQAAVRSGLLRLKAALLQGSPDLLSSSSDFLLPLLKPMSIGAMPVGALVAVSCYYVVKRAVMAYQSRRSALLPISTPMLAQIARPNARHPNRRTHARATEAQLP